MSETAMGKLIAVSLGPGDPGLITRRSWELLQSGAHWSYPIRREGADSYALDIVLRGGLELPQHHTPLIFPMTKDATKLVGYWQRAAEQVVALMQGGEDVLFLIEGDASTYATFGYLAKTVQGLAPEAEIEVVAGVNSFSACAAATGRPLAETDDTVAILPAGYGIEVVERMLKEFDTLVLMKVKPLLEPLLDLLERKGLLQGSYFVERVGTPEQRVVDQLLTLRGEIPNYLSLMIVHNHHRERGEVQKGCGQKIDPNKLEVH